jgi:hypothetical protein
MKALIDFLLNIAIQAAYLVGEGLEWLFRRKASLEETRALRKATYFLWRARALERRGRLEKAYQSAHTAFSYLWKAEPKVTILQMGYMIVVRLDHLGKKLGMNSAARKESEKLLQIIEELPDFSGKQWPELEKIVAWLEYKVSSEPELPHD